MQYCIHRYLWLPLHSSSNKASETNTRRLVTCSREKWNSSSYSGWQHLGLQSAFTRPEVQNSGYLTGNGKSFKCGIFDMKEQLQSLEHRGKYILIQKHWSQSNLQDSVFRNSNVVTSGIEWAFSQNCFLGKLNLSSQKERGCCIHHSPNCFFSCPWPI